MPTRHRAWPAGYERRDRRRQLVRIERHDRARHRARRRRPSRRPPRRCRPAPRVVHVLPISARSAPALEKLVASYRARLAGATERRSARHLLHGGRRPIALPLPAWRRSARRRRSWRPAGGTVDTAAIAAKRRRRRDRLARRAWAYAGGQDVDWRRVLRRRDPRACRRADVSVPARAPLGRASGHAAAAATRGRRRPRRRRRARVSA